MKKSKLISRMITFTLAVIMLLGIVPLTSLAGQASGLDIMIVIHKTTNTGKDLYGWTFNIYADAEMTQLVKGPITTSPGYPGGQYPVHIAPGTYYIQEVDESATKPDWKFDAGVKEVVVPNPDLVDDIRECIVPVYFHNDQLGQMKIIKTTDTGTDVSGWTFNVYSAVDNSLAGTYTTNERGEIVTDYLMPGEYKVEEVIPEDSAYECGCENPQTVTVEPGKVASVTFNNIQKPAAMKIIKTTNTGTDLAGWKFNIYTDIDKENLVEGSPFITDEQGIITEELEAGTYYVEEVDESATKPNWIFDTELRTVTLAAGQIEEVIFNNVQKPGTVKIIKTTNTGADLGGWKFNIYTDSAKTNLVEGSPFTTDAQGVIAKELAAGTYYVEEVDESATKPGWVFDTELKSVTVAPGETKEVSFRNTQLGQAKIVKTVANGDASVEGWTFRIKDVGEFTTDANGVIQKYLMPGTYTIEEVIPEGSLYYTNSENPVTVEIAAGETKTVSFENMMHVGRIQVLKTDPSGNPLAGAKFKLEWSADGSSWAAVTASAGMGGCSSAVQDGCLVTNDEGIAAFEGLYPELNYRLTEVQAPDGYMLSNKEAFNGKLTLAELEVSVTVKNAKIPTPPPDSPTTGDINMPALIGLSALSLVCILGLAILPGEKRTR